LPHLNCPPDAVRDHRIFSCRRFCRPLTWLCSVLLTLSLGVSAAELAQPGVTQLQRDFPPDSIQSTTQSGQAKARLPALKQQLEHDYAVRQNACYKKFFAARCLDQAAQSYRDAKNAIARVEHEADHFDRQQAAADKETSLATRRAAEAAKLPQHQTDAAAQAEKRKVHEQAQAERLNGQGDRVVKAQEKHAQTQRNIDQRAADQKKQAAQAEENSHAYAEKTRKTERKIAERDKHVVEIANKKP